MSIPAGIEAIRKLGAQKGIEVVVSDGRAAGRALRFAVE